MKLQPLDAPILHFADMEFMLVLAMHRSDIIELADLFTPLPEPAKNAAVEIDFEKVSSAI
jgi:hypothetical protein